MNKLEELEHEAFEKGIDIQKTCLPEKISGFFYEDKIDGPLIVLNNSLDTQTEQNCVIAEEIGHYLTSCGNLLTDSNIDSTIINKQETNAKRWAVKKLVSIKNIIKAFDAGCTNFYEMAEYLDVTENFLKDAFEKYNAMYGKFKIRGKYVIYFDPPGIYNLNSRKIILYSDRFEPGG